MSRHGIGQPVRRMEDRRFVQGLGHYVDDIRLPRMAAAAVVYATHAHAKIRSIDIDSALGAPGVVAVLTGRDAEADGLGGIVPTAMPSDWGGPPGYHTVRPILVADRVRCVGDRIALVVADTIGQARDAADMIVVDYEPLAAVTAPDAAMMDGAPLVWEDCPNNCSFTLSLGDPAATEVAFSSAPHRVSVHVRNNRLSANAIEPRTVIGDYDRAEDRYTLHASSQNPHGIRRALAEDIFKIDESRIHVISPDVGGGFGMKSETYPEDALVLWASRRVGRPVKWVATRSESLMSDIHGRDQVADAELALDANGGALGLRVRARQGLGAYIAPALLGPMMFSVRMFPGVYDIPAVDVSSSAVFTNCSPIGPYRGAGRPEACFVLERLMDEGARLLGIDRVEIRRRNLIPAKAMPHTTATGMAYDSGDFTRMMENCLELADWDGFAAREAASREAGLYRGRAVSCYVESAGILNDSMGLKFDRDGSATIIAGTHSHGQGHATVFPQLVHEWLGIPYEKIHYLQGDTEKVAFGRGTYAARSSLVGSAALRSAADAAIAKGRVMAAHLLEADPESIEFRDTLYVVSGANRSMSFGDVAKAFFQPFGLVEDASVGFSATGSAAGNPNFPNGAHVCEVEVDPETGVVRVDRYAVCDDVGRALNPMICEGQIVGGVAQGLGQALVEAVIYDPETGQLLSGSFSDYGMPRFGMVPPIASRLEEVPCATNPLGVKGVGESGTIGAPPTIVNAVLDALYPLGVRDLQMPLTPERVWAAIEAARSGAA